jgi:cell division protein FtsB
MALMEKLSAWIVPVLVGALLTLLFNISGDRATAAQLSMRVDKLEHSVNENRKELAGGGPPALARRVDDLQMEMRRQNEQVANKLDAIQALLMRRQ